MKIPEINIQLPFAQKHLLTLQGWTTEEILRTLDLADQLKTAQQVGLPHHFLKGKTLAMIFSKSSTRTRVSFEVGMFQLGGHALFLSQNDIQLGRGETIADTARVLSRMVDGIMIRTYAQQDVATLAQFSKVPVINGLTDAFHPCQVLADLQTIREVKEELAGLKLCYIGDGNNMAHSLMLGGTKVGMHITVASPPGYQVNLEYANWAKMNTEAQGGSLLLVDDPMEAARDADVIYTDVWASMGQESESRQRMHDFEGYQVNARVMAAAKKDAMFLHCLPAHRGEEVAAQVIDGPQSFVFQEAENRLHAQKAVMALLMKDR